MTSTRENDSYYRDSEKDSQQKSSALHTELWVSSIRWTEKSEMSISRWKEVYGQRWGERGSQQLLRAMSRKIWLK